MAEVTRNLSKLMEDLKVGQYRFEEQISSAIQEISLRFTTLEGKLDGATSEKLNFVANGAGFSSERGEQGRNLNFGNSLKSVRIEMPRFNGNPQYWIFKASNFSITTTHRRSIDSLSHRFILTDQL